MGCDCESSTEKQNRGAVLSAYEYQRFQTGAQPFWTPLRFPGQYHDAETDLFENWNRYYDPNSGRYLQPEPVQQNPAVLRKAAAEGYTLPGYAYALNNPVAYTDPTGLLVRIETDRYWGVLESVKFRLQSCPCVGEWFKKCYGTDPFTNSSDHLIRYFSDETALGCTQSSTSATTNWFTNTTNLCTSLFSGMFVRGSWRAERELGATLLHELSHQVSLRTLDTPNRLGLPGFRGRCSAEEAGKIAYEVFDKGCEAACGCE
jgi:RHS repeat-associated protein